MLLDLQDEQLKAKITRISDGRYRLTVDYPIIGHYAERVKAALADLLRPPTPMATDERVDRTEEHQTHDRF